MSYREYPKLEGCSVYLGVTVMTAANYPGKYAALKIRVAALIWIVLCSSVIVPSATAIEPQAGKIAVKTWGGGPGIDTLVLGVDMDSGTTSGPIAANRGSMEAWEVPVGEHTVQLTGVPGSCEVQGGSQRKIVVEPGKTTPVEFEIVCR